MDPLPRLADPVLARLLRELPTAILLVGPRSAGKTTTLARLAAESIRLDVPGEAEVVRADPDAALSDRREPLLLDEWQEVPEVLGAVKRSLDADRGARPGRFLLTGSVREDLADPHGGWAGTGRVTRFRLYGLTVRERLGRTAGAGLIDRVVAGGDLSAAADPPDVNGYVDLALTSGFPVAVLDIADPATRRLWLNGYVDQLVTRDLDQLAGFSSREPARLRRMLAAYAANSAGTVTDQTLLDAVGVTRPTLRRWELLLEALFLIEAVPAWRAGRTTRLAAAPKRYVVDAGLWAAILGVDRTAILNEADLLGRALDTFVASQLRAEADWSRSPYRLHHVRDRDGREVDLVAELGDGTLVAIEIKATAAPNRHDARHLRWFREQAGGRVAAAILLHTGPRTFPLADGVLAVSVSALWGPGS